MINYKNLILPVAFFICLSSYGQIKSTTDGNYFEKGWVPRSYTIPSEYKTKKETSFSETVSVSIDLSDTIAKVLPTQFGANITFRSGDGIYTDDFRRTMFKKSNMGAYRFPAGSGSNIYFFDGNTPKSSLTVYDGKGNKLDFNPIDGTKSKALKVENFVKFIKALGAEATIVVNYFYARYGVVAENTRKARVLQAAKYAADFVRKVNVELGAGVVNWEVGNECYGDWEYGYDVEGLGKVTGKEYGEDFRVFVREMKKVDPTIKIGAVLQTKETGWNAQVLKEVQHDADFFVIHEYFTSPKDATLENILGSVGKISEDMEFLRQSIADNTDYTLDHYAVALTEFNSRGNYTTNMVNGVFFSQILGEIIKNKIGLATTWTGEWKYNPNDPDNQVKSLLAIGDPDQNNYTPYAAYMAYHFYGKTFGDYMMKANADNPDVGVYASRFKTGEIGVVVVNESSSNTAIKLNLNKLGNYKITDAYWYEIYSNSFLYRDTKFYINGETGTTKGGGPDNFDKVLPYKKSFSNGDTIIIPPYSMNYIVLAGKEETTGIQHNLNHSIQIYPNPVTDKIHIKSDKNIMGYSIYDLSGKCVKRWNYPIKTIDIHQLNEGYYLLQLKTDNKTVTKSFIKQIK
jgi:hypothetical protein